MSGFVLPWGLGLGPLLCALASLSVSACRCSGPEPDQYGDTGDGLAGCRSACAAYSQARCPGRDGAREQAECVERCAAGADLSLRAGCGKLRDGYLACVARSAIDCSAVLSAPGVALGRGEGVPACSAALEALEACEAPCRNEGSTHLGEGSVDGKFVQGEVTRSGCSDCSASTRGGAPPGSPCTAARVCQEHCCSCAGGPARYRARACIAGACAGAEAACSSTPTAVQHSPCAR